MALLAVCSQLAGCATTGSVDRLHSDNMALAERLRTVEEGARRDREAVQARLTALGDALSRNVLAREDLDRRTAASIAELRTGLDALNAFADEVIDRLFALSATRAAAERAPAAQARPSRAASRRRTVEQASSETAQLALSLQAPKGGED